MIRDVVAEAHAFFANVVVVDDGSADESANIAEAAGARVLRHPFNIGQGAALQTGMDFALASGAEYVATFDADGQHCIEDVTVLLDGLRAAQADIALGSRFLGTAESIPSSRRLLLRVACWFTRLTTGLDLTDVHNGIRVMTSEAARRISITHNRMSHASELLEQIAANKLNYIERPVTIRYTAYSLAKGQTMWNSIVILSELLIYGLQRKR